MIVWMYLVSASSMTIAPELWTFSPPGIFTIIALVTLSLFGPIAGLMASIYFGRYKVVRAGLWLMWSGTISIVSMLILQWAFPETKQVLTNSGLPIAITCLSLGFAANCVNFIPFGLDQMPDASGEQIAAFVHWLAWACLAGGATASLVHAIRDCTSLDTIDVAIIESFVSALLLSLALCSSFILKHWLTIEPESRNPLTTVFRVLRFAAKHKHPIRRSAFVYCEPEKPSRIDLAKSKYGGPFTTEEVEDVKTCLRMIVVITSISATVVPAFIVLFSLNDALPTEFSYSSSDLTSCQEHMATRVIYKLVSCIAFSLPVYKVVLYPVVKKWIPNTLKRIGVTLFLTVIASVILLAMSTIWYTHNTSATCIFASGNHFTLSVNRLWVQIPLQFVFLAFVFFLFTVTMEFVCAQSPYNLRGLLLGLVWSVFLGSASLGFGVYMAWRIGYQKEGANSPSCSVWFYLFTTVATTLGCVVWCVMAKRYKKRERDEPERYRIFIEDYYDRYCRLENH